MIGKKRLQKLKAFIEDSKISGRAHSLMECVNFSRNTLGVCSHSVADYENNMRTCLDMMGFPSLEKDDQVIGLAIFRWCQNHLTFKDYVRYGNKIYFQDEENIIRAVLCYGDYLERQVT